MKSLIEDEKVGQEEGGLGYVEVEIDSTLIGDLPVKFMVSGCCWTGYQGEANQAGR